MAALEASRRIRGEGTTAETVWREWLVALQPTTLAIDELLTAAQRLVVVSPHPDDEVLTCGGLLALHARRNGAILIVAVTDGEASHRGDATWPAVRLAAARRMERQRGLTRLGLAADAVTRLGLPDGAVAAHRAALERELQELLRPNDCVVSTWGLDGHPDHDAVGTATASICAEVGCQLLEAPVWMWHWSAPADPRVPWHRLRALPLSVDATERKAAALAEHATQLAARDRDAPVLGPAIRARAARRVECFFVRP